MNRLPLAVLCAAFVLTWPMTAAGAATDRQVRTVPLPQGRTLSIEITVGSIEVEGWARPEAEIQIVRHAPDAAGFARLPVVVDETDAAVRVTNLQVDGTSPEYRTEVRLRVPRSAVLSRVRVMEGRVSMRDFDGAATAEIQRGNIEGRRVTGTLRLETSIGDVVLSEARLAPQGLLRLRAFNGDVRLGLAEVPPDARILALALNGGIESDIPLTMKDTWGPRFGEATLGKGEPVISIDVVTGTIVIRAGK